jgi:elongation factor Ts
MKATTDSIRELRQQTGAGVMDCKKALGEADGDIDKAVNVLRKQGIVKAAGKMSREAREGLIASYIHPGGRIGVLVEINCETDFVAKTDDFKQLVKDITMHIAACEPRYIQREDVPEEMAKQEKEIVKSEFTNKPDQVIEKIAKGRLDKFYGQICLMEQPFVKEEDITVREYVASRVAKLGENVKITRLVRFQLGEQI